MMTEPVAGDQALEPEQTGPVLMPEPTDVDTAKRQNADELWYRSLPFRGRP
jgi:hypothetical protein